MRLITPCILWSWTEAKKQKLHLYQIWQRTKSFINGFLPLFLEAQNSPFCALANLETVCIEVFKSSERSLL